MIIEVIIFDEIHFIFKMKQTNKKSNEIRFQMIIEFHYELS